jgi:hypothetical protein
MSWVLAEKVEEGYFTAKEALLLARQLLYENGMKLFLG